MRIISKTIYLSSVFFLVYPTASFASLSSEYASLVDTSIMEILLPYDYFLFSKPAVFTIFTYLIALS